jgi:hypothetical protein
MENSARGWKGDMALRLFPPFRDRAGRSVYVPQRDWSHAADLTIAARIIGAKLGSSAIRELPSLRATLLLPPFRVL